MSRNRSLSPRIVFPLVRHPDGVLHGRDGHSGWLCRVCGGDVPPPRRTVCSKSCELRLRVVCFPVNQRLAVEGRDRGVCSQCGIDTERLERIVYWARDTLQAWGQFSRPDEILASIGWPKAACRSLWEMDHIVPVAEGGGVRADMTVRQVLGNLRTLCLPCHRAATRQLRRRLAGAAVSES